MQQKKITRSSKNRVNWRKSYPLDKIKEINRQQTKISGQYKYELCFILAIQERKTHDSILMLLLFLLMYIYSLLSLYFKNMALTLSFNCKKIRKLDYKERNNNARHNVTLKEANYKDRNEQ